MFTFRPGRTGQKNGNGGNGQGKNGHVGLNGNGHTNGVAGPTKLRSGQQAAIKSVIGPGVNWKGDLTGAGGLRIEGSFEGNIKITGPLVVAEGAKVMAETIHAGAISVAGTIKANSIVAEKIELLSTGRVYGDLTTGAFASEEGAFLRGQITMQEAPPALEELSGVQPNVA
ncbi:MAG: polymer-forming cytoskeletal protein [Anaerolineales bacterium]|nr:polymer-forming cytoskeletal protein [Anaerolineales bacterium]